MQVPTLRRQSFRELQPDEANLIHRALSFMPESGRRIDRARQAAATVLGNVTFKSTGVTELPYFAVPRAVAAGYIAEPEGGVPEIAPQDRPKLDYFDVDDFFTDYHAQQARLSDLARHPNHTSVPSAHANVVTSALKHYAHNNDDGYPAHAVHEFIDDYGLPVKQPAVRRVAAWPVLSRLLPLRSSEPEPAVQ